jgi:hypothetical protein
MDAAILHGLDGVGDLQELRDAFWGSELSKGNPSKRGKA